jgi:hypothetical protein
MVRPAGDWSTVNEQSVIDLFHSYCGGCVRGSTLYSTLSLTIRMYSARGGAAPSTNYMIAQKYGGSGPIAGSNIYAYVKCMCGNEDKSKAVFSDQLRWLQVMMDC